MSGWVRAWVDEGWEGWVGSWIDGWIVPWMNGWMDLSSGYTGNQIDV